MGGCFDTVLEGMNCLVLDGVFDGGQAALAMKLLDIHWFYYVCIMVYFALTSLTIMNMLIGVVCEIVTRVAHAEAEVRGTLALRQSILEVLSTLDSDQSGRISAEEFHDLFHNHDGLRMLHKAGIDVVGLLECSEYIFVTGDEVPFDDLVDEVMLFRCDNPLTVRDAVDLRLFVMREFDKLLDEKRTS